MRSSIFLIAISALSSTLAAPLPEALPAAAAAAGPAVLFPHDPYSIHRRNTPTLFTHDPYAVHKRDSDSDSSAEETQDQGETLVEVQVQDAAAPAAGPCDSVCGMKRVEGARNEREALCSPEGLKATMECARCIDTAWPEPIWQDSAVAEYDRIVALCEREISPAITEQ